MKEVRTPTNRFLSSTCKPTSLSARGYCDLSLIIYKKELCKSAFEEKKKKDPHQGSNTAHCRKKKGVPLIYHSFIAFSLKIFPTFKTKNAENMKLSFLILCVLPKLFLMKIFPTIYNLTYFQAYFSFSLKMKMKMSKPNTP